MNRRPVIGITTDHSDTEPRYMSTRNYATAIERAGGLPLLLPYDVDHALIPQYVDLLDGVCFSGGNDMDPAKYGEDCWHPQCTKMDPKRQEFEFALLREVEKRRMPVLGVCFGSQLMNVYRGGSLIQFLPDHPIDNRLEHRNLPDAGPGRHDIRLDLDSQLGRAIGTSEVSVNTYHKQAVRKIGRGLRVIGTAPDGVIEAFEDPTFPLFAAVQWHPERLIDEPEHLAPFKLLVERSAEAKQR
ncbi:MAG TPA: gamma-glutamyl-gamma-aminobutyrate hydrolase family protein [Tepidisphaeraceae bacterium]|nr:gamma-glutamyl-gamma-aminobutyrate hydrolase family protein [Tepidisphaeraceae bacterium]